MKRKLTLALVLCGLSCFLTQTSYAAQALAVASNGKWAMAWTYSPDVSAASAQAIEKCRAQGGLDPKVVWSTWGSGRMTHWAPVHGAVAVSDNGTGTIVGWSFNHPYHNRSTARMECRKKGGHNPKVFDIGKES
jgi:hypothetical protein